LIITPQEPADAFPTVVVKFHRRFPRLDQLLVQHVQQFQKGHVRAGIGYGIALEGTGGVGARLSPDVEVEFHERF
jgi:DNA-binding transcriptional LysR family regulator